LTPADLLDEVIERHAGTVDPRLREIITALLCHLHAFTVEVRLTEPEWAAGIEFLTATGQMCDGNRQEFILASDVLGLSMLVDLMAHDVASPTT
jgi:hydroxyquinol 1,2-dioxygenase